ncbi:MAG: HAMP domain-containing sensor histidine kinase [Phycisphaerae bacterium]
MKLRQKFGVLALIYVLSLSANLVMSGWCIVVYFQSAFVDVQSSFVRQSEVERWRMQVQVAKAQLELPASDLDSIDLTGMLIPLRQHADARVNGAFALREDDAERDHWHELATAIDAGNKTIPTDLLSNCDAILGKISALITTQRHDAVHHAATTQQRVVTILIANAIVGAALCIAGLILVRRWVLQPVAKLRIATKDIAAGHFDYRINPQSADELGALSNEVNQMSGTIVDMQAKLVEQERQAAAGEMFRRIAHNIRNPLAGIRGLAEATQNPEAHPQDVAEYQGRIIKAIDRLEQWLRQLQHSVEPMNIAPQRTDLAELIENVCNVMTPTADRAGVQLAAVIDPESRFVVVDGFHFEQALVALITNAIQASRLGQTVRIRVASNGDRLGHWSICVDDEGAGIATELQSKVFLPNFTTRSEGNGLGLAMVAKVVHTHGGRIHCVSSPGMGSTFEAIMPGRIDTPDRIDQEQ